MLNRQLPIPVEAGKEKSLTLKNAASSFSSVTRGLPDEERFSKRSLSEPTTADRQFLKKVKKFDVCTSHDAMAAEAVSHVT